MIDKILIISLEKDKARRERIYSLIEREPNKSLAKKTAFIKGVHFSKINEEFLSRNNLDYYRSWPITEQITKEIEEEYSKESSIYKVGCGRFYKKELKRGQLGCLLGHIQCWREIVSKGYDSALILEDDSFWDKRLSEELEYLKSQKDSWIKGGIDFCFLGRESHLENREQEWELDRKYVIPEYSYNSHSYILTYQGAIKLLSQEPHKKLMSADEFLGASYSRHPRSDIRQLIKRNLNAISLRYNQCLIYQALGENINLTNIEDSGSINET